ncbi:secreted protein [Rhodopirellula sallentina SM41]|uniref:Secreted protein n=1 Tax=Rhodopirellula sallentina SM41 TaxID=1263870 RepID=M5U605_9BACT|nr:secreted protein [Rhodopirellula sallentina SM41]
MKSPLLAVLLIVNLLACPLRCLPCGATAVADEQPATTQCHGCCHDDAASTQEQREQSSPCSDGCGMHDCICEGAVVEISGPHLPADVPLEWLVLNDVLSGFSFRSNTLLPRSSAVVSGRHSCGRDVRVAHQSWLI